MKKLILLSLVVIFLLAGPLAFAWDGGKFGLFYRIDPVGRIWLTPTATFPQDFNTEKIQNVGIVYNFSPKVALKASVLFAFLNGKFESAGTEVANYSSTVIGVQVDIPISVVNVNKFDFYIAPAVRFAYAPIKYEEPPGTVDEDLKFTEIAGIVNFGGQIMITDNFAVFGEWGVAFTYSMVKDDLFDFQGSGTAIHTDQVGIGISFYVN
jgi:hypothetical protein